jgi:hypothetical protein
VYEREENRLRVFENRLLSKIFVPKRDNVTWKWRKMQNEKLHILYATPNFRLLYFLMSCGCHRQMCICAHPFAHMHTPYTLPFIVYIYIVLTFRVNVMSIKNCNTF